MKKMVKIMKYILGYVAVESMFVLLLVKILIKMQVIIF